ncbi:hypothetical protein NP493_2g12002 [Ridgeia piscesae]|uniref:Uncharacterized protein n=1 Tax=Ridgeia piscesae TaxID=27915 RepID=A0AAD9PG17_RIDPI|nr:hypothetical protein NP493_2g12002 [Ridgeia piscesae]
MASESDTGKGKSPDVSTVEVFLVFFTRTSSTKADSKPASVCRTWYSCLRFLCTSSVPPAMSTVKESVSSIFACSCFLPSILATDLSGLFFDVTECTTALCVRGTLTRVDTAVNSSFAPSSDVVSSS